MFDRFPEVFVGDLWGFRTTLSICHARQGPGVFGCSQLFDEAAKTVFPPW